MADQTISNGNAKATLRVTTSKMTVEQELAALRAENDALRAKAAKQGTFTCKVSEKGALSVYGLGRFPITLYVGQWEKLWANIDKVQAFAAANASVLSRKE